MSYRRILILCQDLIHFKNLQIDLVKIKKYKPTISFETKYKFETFLSLRKTYSFNSIFLFSSWLGLQEEIERGVIWKNIQMLFYKQNLFRLKFSGIVWSWFRWNWGISKLSFLKRLDLVARLEGKFPFQTTSNCSKYLSCI